MPKRVIILHGYSAKPQAHWFPWLSEQLMRDGVQVDVPAMPGTEAPELDRWVSAAIEAFGSIDENLVVVGHSLGCITALHALAGAGASWKLGGLVLVSGFSSAVPALPEIVRFTVSMPDLAALASRTRYRAVISSDNDDIVPPALSKALADELDASIDIVPGAGHFLDREGHITIPIAYEHVRSAFARAT